MQKGEQVDLDGLADRVQRQVIETIRGERLLQFDADLIQRQHGVGEQDRYQRGQPFFLELVQQGERQRPQVEQNEAAYGNRVRARQRRVADAFASTEIVDQRRPFAFRLQEREAVHPVSLAALAQQFVNPQSHERRYVLGGLHARGFVLAQQSRQLRHPVFAAQPSLGGVGERRRPADHLFAPASIRRPVGQGRQRQVPRLIDDAAPQLPRFPPAVVTRVGTHHEQQTQQHSADLVRSDFDRQVGVLQGVEQGNERGEGAEGDGRRQHTSAGGPAPGERLHPETSRFRQRFRHQRTS